MLSSVLNSQRAIDVNIAIVRAFVKLRKLIESHKNLAEKLEEIEKKYDHQFKIVFDVLKQLMEPEKNESKQEVGFRKEV